MENFEFELTMLVSFDAKIKVIAANEEEAREKATKIVMQAPQKTFKGDGEFKHLSVNPC